MYKKLFVLSLIVLAIFGQSYAQQTRAEIQQKQKELQQELNDLNSSLSDVRKNKKLSIRELELVQQKINARQSLIVNINSQLSDLDETIILYNKQVDSCKKQLDTLKSKYAQSIVFAYKNRNNYSYISFLFAASSFNDAFRRIAYLKSYRQYRESQATNIVKAETNLKQNIVKLENTKRQKNNALTLQGTQLQGLQTDKLEKDSTLNSLKGQEGDLSKQIEDNAEKRRRLQTLLQSVIRREIAEAEEKERQRQAHIAAEKRAAEERARIAEQQKEIADKQQSLAINSAPSSKPATTTSPTRKPTTRKPTQTNNQPIVTKPTVQPNVAVDKTRPAQQQTDNAATQTQQATTPPNAVAANTPANTERENRSYNVLENSDESLEQSLDFEKNRGHLPWPVNGGFISEDYGVQTIPGTNLKQENDGIEISSNGTSTVKSVASGVVSYVSNDDGYSVIIRHGKYFTTYSNLSSVSVNRGDNVNAGSVIGQMSSDGSTKNMFFMVTDSKGNPMNPKSWIGAH